jgi:hypothetical protein
MVASSIALASQPSLCWHHRFHCAGDAALVMLALLPLLRWCFRCLRRGLPHRPRLNTCQLNDGKDACELTARHKHNEGKEGDSKDGDGNCNCNGNGDRNGYGDGNGDGDGDGDGNDDGDGNGDGDGDGNDDGNHGDGDGDRDSDGDGDGKVDRKKHIRLLSQPPCSILFLAKTEKNYADKKSACE